MPEPKAALDAVLETDKDVGGINVKPLTTARYALLELLGSPFVDPSAKFTTANIVPSLYVMQAERQDLKGFGSRNVGELEERAFEWADGIDLSKVGPAVDEVAERFRLVWKTAPGEGQADDGKKN